MSQADNYTPQEVVGTTATLDVVLPWTFDGIDELEISQTDGSTTVTLDNNDFDAFVDGQTVTVENFYESGNFTTITVSRATKKTQEYTLSESNNLDSEAMNESLNKIVRMIQDTAFKTDVISDSLSGGDLAALLLNVITSDNPFDIPTKENRQSVWMGFDENGNLFLGVPDGVEPPGGPVTPSDFLRVLTDIKIVTTTAYTLLNDDTGKFIIFTNAADVEVTSPNDVTLGHQVMYLKTGSTNEIKHVAASGAEHVNSIPVVASKQYAWYSHTVFENSGGSSAKYRFIGEIDTTDINNIELVSRTLNITASFTHAEAQALIDSAGKYLNPGVELKILFEDGTLLVDSAVLIVGFSGPGLLTVGTLTEPAYDTTTARPVSITNTNEPNLSEYQSAGIFDNASQWDAYLKNSAIFISGCTCSQIQIFGFSFNAKVFPVVVTSTSSLIYFRGNFCNQINAFTSAEFNRAAGINTYGGNMFIDMNKFTTDTDTNGLNLHATRVQLQNSDGNGSYLLRGDTAAGVAEGASNTNFAWTVNKFKMNGFLSTGEIEG